MPGEPIYKKRGLRGVVWNAYRKWLRPRISSDIGKQRLKLLWHGWGYWRLLAPSRIPALARLRLLVGFLRVDWRILHAHKPAEMSRMLLRLAQRPARPGEVVVEAGCWRGGSTAKFSLACRELGYGLEVYDSFEGVAAHEVVNDETDFAGTYAAGEELVRANVAATGAVEVCRFHKGWFSDTLRHGVGKPIRMLYIDCDIVEGTRDALEGGLPDLVDDGLVYSQDFHIRSVREYLETPATWEDLGYRQPGLVPEAWNLVRIEATRA
jgi:O-methyltransferase